MGKVTKGAPMRIPAADWNGLQDVLGDYRRRRELGLGLPAGIDRRPVSSVKVKNSSGGDLDAGSVLELQDTLFEPERRHIWFDGDTPAAGGLPWGVLVNQLIDGGIGELQLAGICRAIVHINATGDTRAYIKSGQTKLEGGQYGHARILANPSGATGDQVCVLLLNAVAFGWIAKTGGGGVTARSGTTIGSGTVTLYDTDLTTSLGTTTAYNLADAAVAADTWIMLKPVEPVGALFVDWEHCA